MTKADRLWLKRLLDEYEERIVERVASRFDDALREEAQMVALRAMTRGHQRQTQ